MKYLRYLYDTRIIALILSLPFLFLFPFKENKYRTELKVAGARSTGPRGIVYDDLNGDGKTEKIYHFRNSQGMLSFQVYDLNEGLYDQWNFPGKFYHNADKICIGDPDRNGFKEVAGFTLDNDSLFFRYCEPLGKNPSKITTVFVTTFDPRKGYETDFSVTDAAFHDMDGDSFEDLVFIVKAGYSLQPRKIFIYNFRNGSFNESRTAGNVIDHLNFTNLDNDSMPEIIGGQQSEFNIPENTDIPYADRNPWLMVYDNDLSYFFPPVPFPEIYARLMTDQFLRNKERILILWYHPYRLDTIKPLLIATNTEGKIIGTDTLKNIPPDNHYSFLKLDQEHFVLLPADGRIIKFNSHLEKLKEILLEKPTGNPIMTRDFNGDGKNEIVLTGRDLDKLYIVSENLRNISSTDLSGSSPYFLRSSPDPGSLSMIIDNTEYRLFYKFNPVYYLRFPLFVLLYGLLLGIVHIIKKIQEKRLQEQYALDTQMRTLELNAFRSQMDPHFTFNVFNIVASLLNKGNREEAMDAFLKFSNLIRQNLEKYDNITRKLDEELGITLNFLELTKLRYPEFTYELEKDESADTEVVIPKMIILTHVENAVKHGLGPKGGRGKILISINNQNGFLSILVEDNGTGRKTGQGNDGSSTGLGLMILDKLIQHLNRSSVRKITQTIIDLKDSSGMPAGTKVEIVIPL